MGEERVPGEMTPEIPGGIRPENTDEMSQGNTGKMSPLNTGEIRPENTDFRRISKIRPGGFPRERMEIRRRGELVYLTFPLFDKVPGLRHCFSTRHGGVSQGFLSTMNFSFRRGDDPAAVTENYRRIAEAIGVDPASFTTGRQTHTVNLKEVTRAERGTGVSRPSDWMDIDGLYTGEPDITLVTVHADCVPVWIADPVKRAAALVHAGWKGTVGEIAVRAIQALREHYGSSPADLLCCVGPAICGDCYEVGADVEQEIRKLFPGAEADTVLYRPHLDDASERKIQLDLLEANALLLQRAGVPRDQIAVGDICTRCNPDHLFSHRAHGVRRGLNAAFLGFSQEV